MEHKDIKDPNIHEVKGASTATAGSVLTSNGDGTTSFITPTKYSNVKLGSYRVVNGSTTKVALTTPGTYYTLTNDGLGGGTSFAYGIAGVTGIWNNGTNRFDFTKFDLGDSLIIHADFNVTTTSANTAIDVGIEFAIGASVYTIPIITGANIKTASTVRFTEQRWVVLRDADTRDYPARIKATADTAGAEVLVREFDLGVFKRG